MRCGRALTLVGMTLASVHDRASDVCLVRTQVMEWMVRWERVDGLSVLFDCLS